MFYCCNIFTYMSQSTVFTKPFLHVYGLLENHPNFMNHILGRKFRLMAVAGMVSLLLGCNVRVQAAPNFGANVLIFDPSP